MAKRQRPSKQRPTPPPTIKEDESNIPPAQRKPRKMSWGQLKLLYSDREFSEARDS